MSPQSDDAAGKLRRLAGDAHEFTLTPLVGGASDRWYLRLTGPLAKEFGEPSLIVMGVEPSLRDILDSFLSVRRFLAANDLPAPKEFGAWPGDGLVLLEDFADLTMTEAVRRDPEGGDRLYDQALSLLVHLHSCADDPAHHCSAFDLAFDEEKFRFEYDFHVRQWLIAHYFGANPTEAEQAVLDQTFERIGSTLAAEPRVFTHRDYQSSNLLVRRDGTLGLVDFQDARQGLRTYDLASLLYDSYTGLRGNDRVRLAHEYHRLVYGRDADERFMRLLTIAAIQRKMHDAGAFVYAAAHRGKTDYLDFVRPTLRMAIGLMETVEECRQAAAIIASYARRRGGT